MSIADDPIFHDAEAAREWLEALLWTEGPICPHCGLIGAAYKMHNKSQRPGVYKCKGCEEQFTVTVGTVFERSHIPLNKWLFAFSMMVASKKGVSAHQIHRMIGITYKSAWFMCHRIREALTTGPLAKFGGANKVVEIDETYVGGKEANKHKFKRTPGRQGGAGKAPVVALVERDGTMRSAARGERERIDSWADHRQANRQGELHHDGRKPRVSAYRQRILGPWGGQPQRRGICACRVLAYEHSGELLFSILKRGIIGTYHHVSEAHLHRYLAEFDFRYNQRARLGIDDAQRLAKAAKGIAGKRLTYRRARRNEKAEDEIPF